jgi:Transposase IS116/IS110/IS902 family
VLVAADPQLCEALAGLSNLRLIRRCAQLEIDTPQDATSAAAYTLRLLARWILTLTDEIRELEHQITITLTSHSPHLLSRCGIGPDNAAAVLIAAGDNPDRLRSEASFAALCGVSPWKPPQARPAGAASTAVVTAKPIPRSTASPCPGYAGMPAPATTSPVASPRAKPAAKPSTASSDTSPAKSTGSSHLHPKPSDQLLDIHRGICALVLGQVLTSTATPWSWCDR